MPSAQDILNVLASASAGLVPLAIAWHALLGLAIILVLVGWRPARKLGALLLLLPFISVILVSFFYNSLFNFVVFIVFAVILAILALAMGPDCTYHPPAWGVFFGWLMLFFAWIYPHFRLSASWVYSLYGTPLGLIPCPTLSMVVGFALLADGFRSRGWTWVLIVLGLFYGLFGTLRLGVWIDVFLLVGTLMLVAEAVTLKRRCEISDTPQV
jgi:hypothetical protein